MPFAFDMLSVFYRRSMVKLRKVKEVLPQTTRLLFLVVQQNLLVFHKLPQSKTITCDQLSEVSAANL